MHSEACKRATISNNLPRNFIFTYVEKTCGNAKIRERIEGYFYFAEK